MSELVFICPPPRPYEGRLPLRFRLRRAVGRVIGPRLMGSLAAPVGAAQYHGFKALAWCRWRSRRKVETRIDAALSEIGCSPRDAGITPQTLREIVAFPHERRAALRRDTRVVATREEPSDSPTVFFMPANPNEIKCVVGFRVRDGEVREDGELGRPGEDARIEDWYRRLGPRHNELAHRKLAELAAWRRARRAPRGDDTRLRAALSVPIALPRPRGHSACHARAKHTAARRGLAGARSGKSPPADDEGDPEPSRSPRRADHRDLADPALAALEAVMA